MPASPADRLAPRASVYAITPPVKARLVAASSAYSIEAPVEKGDTDGHPFRGNQWTGGLAAGAEGKQGAVGPVRVTAFRAGPMKERGRGVFFAGTHEDAAAYSTVHDGAPPVEYEIEAANAYVAESPFALHRTLFGATFQDAVYAADKRSGFKSSKDATLAVESKMARKLRAMGHDALVYTAPPAPAKTEIAVLNPKTARITERMKKGDAVGHPFRGNQWTDGEGGADLGDGGWRTADGEIGDEHGYFPDVERNPQHGIVRYAGVSDRDWDEWTVQSEPVNEALAGRLKVGDMETASGSRLDAKGVADIKRLAQAVNRAARRNAVKAKELYRGESYDSAAEVRARYKVGSTIETDRLTSVTGDLDTARTYAGIDRGEMFSGGDVKVIVHVANKHGVIPGVQTAPLGVLAGEVVMPRGVKYRVMRVEEDTPGVFRVDLYSTERHELPSVPYWIPPSMRKVSFAGGFTKGDLPGHAFRGNQWTDVAGDKTPTADRSPEFREWFGNSKVALFGHDKGNYGKPYAPATVWHGTFVQEPIEVFDRKAGSPAKAGTHTLNELGIWFGSSRDHAEQWSGQAGERKRGGPVGEIKAGPVGAFHLSIQNPKVVKWEDVPKLAVELRAVTKDFDRKRKPLGLWGINGDKMRAALIKQGFDGLRITDGGEGDSLEPGAYWVAFNPEQVKSVANAKPTKDPSIHKGDSPGHPFRGNQYTDGSEGGAWGEQSDAEIAREEKEIYERQRDQAGYAESYSEHKDSAAFHRQEADRAGKGKAWREAHLAAADLHQKAAEARAHYDDLTEKDPDEVNPETVAAQEAAQAAGKESRRATDGAYDAERKAKQTREVKVLGRAEAAVQAAVKEFGFKGKVTVTLEEDSFTLNGQRMKAAGRAGRKDITLHARQMKGMSDDDVRVLVAHEVAHTEYEKTRGDPGVRHLYDTMTAADKKALASEAADFSPYAESWWKAHLKSPFSISVEAPINETFAEIRARVRTGEKLSEVCSPRWQAIYKTILKGAGIKKGDFDGHPFRGNQYTSGGAGLPDVVFRGSTSENEQVSSSFPQGVYVSTDPKSAGQWGETRAYRVHRQPRLLDLGDWNAPGAKAIVAYATGIDPASMSRDDFDEAAGEVFIQGDDRAIARMKAKGWDGMRLGSDAFLIGTLKDYAARDPKKGDLPGHPFRGNQWTEGQRSWDDFPWDEATREKPREKDIAPERTAEGDFVFYHGTSDENADSIIREMNLRPDDLGAVGVGTRPSDVSIFGYIRGRKTGTVVRVVIARDEAKQHRAIHEIGGSNHNQYLFEPESGIKRGWPGVKLKEARVVRRRGEDVEKGDLEGHPFRGNQYTQGSGEADAPTEITGKDVETKLAPDLAAVAQAQYEAWDEALVDEYAGGGICHLIAEDIAADLNQRGIDASTVSALQGEQHVWVVARLKDGVYSIDIPPGVYERGGGYSWTKKPGVVIGAGDLVIDRIDKDPARWEDYIEAAAKPGNLRKGDSPGHPFRGNQYADAKDVPAGEKPPKPTTPAEWRDLGAKQQARIDEIVAAGEQPLSFPDPTRPEGARTIIHRSPGQGREGKWRVTDIDADGFTPTGHEEAGDFADALRVARMRGTNLWAKPERLDARRVAKGDFSGHPFRGNQHTDGGGQSVQALAPAARSRIAPDENGELHYGGLGHKYDPEYSNAGEWIPAEAFHEAEVDVASLVWTQPDVQADRVDAILRDYEAGKFKEVGGVAAIKVGNRYHVLDGHHRVSAAGLMGVKRIRVRAATPDDIDLDAMMKGDLPGHPFRGNQYADGQGEGERAKVTLTEDADGTPIYTDNDDLPNRQRKVIIAKQATALARRLGFDPKRIEVSMRPAPKLDGTWGAEFSTAGTFNERTGKITIYGNNVSAEDYGVKGDTQGLVGIVAHEIGHAQYAAAIERIARDGKLTTDANLLKLASADGVTEYSKSFWKRVGKVSIRNLQAKGSEFGDAMHETVAEINAKVATGVPLAKACKPVWRKFYREVMRASGKKIRKGDFEGHPFRGNQWTQGAPAGGGDAATEEKDVGTSLSDAINAKTSEEHHEAAAFHMAHRRELEAEGKLAAAEAHFQAQVAHREAREARDAVAALRAKDPDELDVMAASQARIAADRASYAARQATANAINEEDNERDRIADANVAKVIPLVSDAKKGLNYEGPVQITDREYPFVLDGVERKAWGSANLETGEITIYANQAAASDPKVMQSLLAHEVGHLEYEAASRRVDEEGREISRQRQFNPLWFSSDARERARQVYDGGPGYNRPDDPDDRDRFVTAFIEKNAIERVDGSLTENGKKLYAERFPIHHALRQMSGTNESSHPLDRLRREDGVSEYSRAWWRDLEAGKATYPQAIHETFAEIRASVRTGYRLEDVAKPVWQEYYRLMVKLGSKDPGER